MSSHIQLRIATRIHYGLKQWLGEGIDVGAMLKRPHVAQEVLWVCDASGREDLIELARQYRHEARQEMKPMPAIPEGASEKPPALQRAAYRTLRPEVANAAPQDAAWARDTSGFGLTELPSPAATMQAATSGWARATDWLRRATAR